MCRWLAYSGSPILLEDLLYKPVHSLIDQSLHSRLGVETTNGDGFGVGWYGDGDDARRVPEHRAGLERPQPARARRPHRRAARVRPHPRLHGHRRCSRRTATRSATAAGCGCTTARSRGFQEVKRELTLAVDPALYPAIEGSTDSEMFFYLALTLASRTTRRARWTRTVGLRRARRPRARHRAPDPDDRGDHRRRARLGLPLLQRGPLALAVLLHRACDTLRELHPDNSRSSSGLSDETRLVVSEPLGDLAGAWNEVPESSYGVVHDGQDELHPFTPRPPT